MEKQNVQDNSYLLDSVECGLVHSERLHEGSGSFAVTHGHIPSDYSSLMHVVPHCDGMKHWRGFAQSAQVALKVPRGFLADSLSISICIRSYETGGMSDPPQPTLVRVRVGDIEYELGAPVIPPDGQWYIYEYDLKPEWVPERKLEVLIDDNSNVPSPTRHYGKALGNVLLFGQGQHE